MNKRTHLFGIWMHEDKKEPILIGVSDHLDNANQALINEMQNYDSIKIEDYDEKYQCFKCGKFLYFVSPFKVNEFYPNPWGI